MGLLSDIFHKIFPSDHPANAGGAASTAPTDTTAGAPAPVQSTQAMPPVDVNAILTEKAGQSAQKLNWQTSIVDLLKLLGLDSSLDSRKQLAKELGYSGDTNDSATMNVWLQKQVMAKLAANGGKVPAGLQ